MSSVRFRLLLRDTTAMVAFGSIAISGQLPVPTMVLFVIAALFALVGVRKISIGAGRVIIIASVIVVGFLGLTGRIDTVVAAASFATLLCSVLLHQPPTRTVDSQVHLLALLMVAAGAALSADIGYFLFVVAFAVLATFSLGAGVLEASAMRMGEPTPLRPGFRRLAVGLAATLVGAGIFFVVFPRLSWNVASRQSGSGGAPVTGFTGEVRLGAGGGASIKNDPRPVLRARLDPDPRRDELNAYWFGKALDTFDGSAWTSRRKREGGRLQILLEETKEHGIEQEIELLAGYGSQTLVALETPVEFITASIPSGFSTKTPVFINVPDEQVRMQTPMPGLTYRVRSVPGAPVTETVAVLDRYRALPPALDPRVAELAAQLLGTETDPERAAQRMVAYLKANYRYSLDLPAAASENPLGDFLFERKQGYCEHFATALAVMLRTRGIPTRVVTGFFGGQRVDDVYVVRAADAHAWVQVWVDGRGFVAFDATPESFRSGQSSRIFTWVARQYETIERLWRTQVVEYSFLDQARYAQRAFERLRPKPPDASTSSQKLPDLRPWVGVLLLVALAYGLYRLGRARPTDDEVKRLGARLTGLLVHSAFPMRSTETLEDYGTRLRRSGHPLALSLPRILRRYLEARFGTRPLEPTEAEALLSAARAALTRTESPPTRRAA